ILNDFVDQKTIYHFKTRKVKLLRFVQHQRRDAIVEAAAKVSEPGMFLLDVMPVDNVIIFAFQFVQHPDDFFGWVLTIVIQHRDVTSARLSESRQNGAVLAEITAQMHERHQLRKLLRQLGANLFAVISGSVVHQDDLKRSRCKDLHDVVDQWTDRPAAIINRNYQR